MKAKPFRTIRNVCLIAAVLTSIVGSSISSAANVGWKGIATGTYHSLAIKTDGTVWAWGRNFSGELGNGLSGGKEQEINEPKPVKGINSIIAVAGGYKHSLALKSDGTVWAWGNNVNGELGDGTKTIMDYQTDPDKPIKTNHNQLLPQKVNGLTNVTAIAAGLYSSYALKSDGTLWFWGNDQLKPKQFAGLSNISAIAIGLDHYIALKKDGTVWTWGANAYGQLGNGKGNDPDIEVIANAIQYIDAKEQPGPTMVKGLTQVKAISAGDYYRLALRSDGSVWAWGSNNNGQLGNGTIKNQTTPALIKSISKVNAIVAGTGSSIFLKTDGTVWATGDNIIGQLGIGSEADSLVPVRIKSLAGINRIAGGTGLHFMAQSAKNVLWVWGLNSNGQIGSKDESNKRKPAWIKASETEVQPKPIDNSKDIIQVRLDSNLLSFDQQPMIINDRTMVPLRKIFEAMGAEVTWDEATKTVTATKNLAIVTLTIGSNSGTLNGTSIPLEAPAVIIKDRTLVPVRFIAESFDARVTWDAATTTANIESRR